MVFEQLFKFKPLKASSFNIFIMGFIFSELGILSALFVFPNLAGLMSIAFTAVITIPYLYNLLMQEKTEIRKSTFFLRSIVENNKIIFKSYILLFFGIFLSYVIYAIFLPEFNLFTLFENQLKFLFLSGSAVQPGSFTGILFNNFTVLIIFFVFSILFGVGSVLFLTWNASVWGTILGYLIKTASQATHNIVQSFLVTFFKFLPHLITEASAYLLAIISGLIISQTFITVDIKSERFDYTILEGIVVLGFSLLLLIIAAYMEVYLFPLF